MKKGCLIEVKTPQLAVLMAKCLKAAKARSCNAKQGQKLIEMQKLTAPKFYFPQR
jgi:hypothetical protein